MKKVSWNDVLSFLVLAAMTLLMVWMVVRDIDKDVERECGYHRYEDAPSYCESWWDDKGVEREPQTPKDPAIKSRGIN